MELSARRQVTSPRIAEQRPSYSTATDVSCAIVSSYQSCSYSSTKMFYIRAAAIKNCFDDHLPHFAVEGIYDRGSCEPADI